MGNGVGRMNGTDFALCPSHTCKKKVCCHPPHKPQGPATTGASQVKVNKVPVLRLMIMGTHDKNTCCGANQWIAFQTASDHQVNVEGQPIFCVGDISQHDQKDLGKLMVGSTDVVCRK